MGSHTVIGADLGKLANPSAVCVAELVWRPKALQAPQPGEEALRAGTAGKETHFLCHHLERVPLGTPYPQV